MPSRNASVLKPAVIDDAAATHLVSTFQALADRTRARLVSALLEQELCVGDLAAALGMSPSAVSHQLRILRDLRLVRTRRAGRAVYYALDDHHIHEIFRLGLEHVTHG